MSHVRVRKFRVPQCREDEFEAACDSNGRWDSHAGFDAFTREFGEDYRALATKLGGVAGEEAFVGAFEKAGG